MALASAKRKAAALTAVLAGAVLAGCGPQAVHGRAQASRPSRTAAASPATPAPHRIRTLHAPSSATTAAPPAPRPTSAAPRPRRTQAPAAPVRTTRPTPASRARSLGPAPGATGRPRRALGPATAIEYAAEGTGRTVALTFDDGPDPRWTPQVLALLARHHARATFCEIGPNAARYPYLVRDIVAAGDRLCDHSVHHDEQQSGKSAEYNLHEIADAQRMIADAAGPGADLGYYRAPGGDFSPVIRKIAAEHGLRPLGWTVDSEDWRRPGVARILRTIHQELRPGGIVLMHDAGGDRSETVQALSILLDELDAQGYTYTFPAR